MIPNSDRKLESFRYDSRLFKQAYKAGIEAKIFEKKRKQKRLLIISVLVLTIPLILLSAIFLLRAFPHKLNYIPVNVESSRYILDSVDISFDPSAKSSYVYDERFVDAKAAIYADLDTGEILYAKNIDEQLPIASLTKLMTAIVGLKYYQLSDIVEVKTDWYKSEDMEWSIQLDKGDSVDVETLLNAMLISSYNDAAQALADNFDGGWEMFVEEMNEYSKLLGLDSTEFSNPTGLDTFGGNKSTVEDLYKLSSIVYRSSTIMDIISKTYADIEWDIGSKRIYTTNAINDKYGNIAGKTGVTDLAGPCFMGFTNDGRVTIVLNSSDRFLDTKNLLQSQ